MESSRGPSSKHATVAECPECATELNLPEGTMESEVVGCPGCGAELEVVTLDPPQPALAPEVEEDWGERHRSSAPASINKRFHGSVTD